MISIVVPVYNAAGFIKETIGSVKRQTYTDWELLLIDDCSSDGSVSIMEEEAAHDPRIRVIRQPQNMGAAAARNRGVQEAKGRYLAYLDADDLWRDDRLSSCLAFIEEKKVAFVFSGYEFADENGRGLGKIVRVPECLTYAQALKNTTIFTSTVLFDLEKIPKDLVSMPRIKSEDTATWWRILRNGYTAYGLDRNLVLYRRSAGTLSSNKLEAIRRIWHLYRDAEQLSVPYSFYNFVFYALRAVLRRV
ncbi:MAG: glycosyltransferase family 2 protein [Lachnospiraceae bacterium]|nr:glycosyltransferase family 2 protein [Lachnospiraceae bacterium]